MKIKHEKDGTTIDEIQLDDDDSSVIFVSDKSDQDDDSEDESRDYASVIVDMDDNNKDDETASELILQEEEFLTIERVEEEITTVIKVDKSTQTKESAISVQLPCPVDNLQKKNATTQVETTNENRASTYFYSNNKNNNDKDHGRGANTLKHRQITFDASPDRGRHVANSEPVRGGSKKNQNNHSSHVRKSWKKTRTYRGYRYQPYNRYNNNGYYNQNYNNGYHNNGYYNQNLNNGYYNRNHDNDYFNRNYNRHFRNPYDRQNDFNQNSLRRLNYHRDYYINQQYNPRPSLYTRSFKEKVFNGFISFLDNVFVNDFTDDYQI